ncbi:hypothetical protein QW131_33025 [Roseibium salinum]|nr:hypothetical protein [Roseibium salinum]
MNAELTGDRLRRVERNHVRLLERGTRDALQMRAKPLKSVANILPQCVKGRRMRRRGLWCVVDHEPPNNIFSIFFVKKFSLTRIE